MIDITPIDIRKKKRDFPRSIRGYDPAEVDLFLDLVADRLEEVVGETMRLEERLGQVEAALREYTDREKSLTEALVAAQALREESRHQAGQEAELIRREAELEAGRIRADAMRAREQEGAALRRLRARRAQLLQTFRSFLERELGEVNAMAEALEAEEAGLGAVLEPGIPQPPRVEAPEEAS